MKWNDAYVGFCAIRPYPNGSLNFSRAIHRLVILPDFQGLGLGTKFLETLCKMYVDKGYKMFIRTAHESLAHHFKNSSLWKEGPRNGKKGGVYNCRINGPNQNMYIVNSERFSYEYVGEDFATKPHKEIVIDSLVNIDMKEMRKMLVNLKRSNYITVVHGKIKEKTAINALCCELGVRTELLYNTQKGVDRISRRHLGKSKMISLKPGHKPVYRKVA